MRIWIFTLVILLSVTAAYADSDNKVCPAVCTSLYEVKDNTCVLNYCGSGCGADNSRSFTNIEACKSSLISPEVEQGLDENKERIEERIETLNKIILNKADESFEEGILVNITSTVRGLENAILHVENENARARIQRNLERWQEKHNFQYDKINATEVDDLTVIKGTRHFNILFLKIPIIDKYQVDDEGNIIAEKRSLLSKFFTRKILN